MEGGAAPEGAGGEPLQKPKASRRAQSRGCSSPFRGRCGRVLGPGATPLTATPPSALPNWAAWHIFPSTGYCVPGLQSPRDR